MKKCSWVFYLMIIFFLVANFSKAQDVEVWYGTVDGTPLQVPIGQEFLIPVFISTYLNLYSVHVVLGTDDYFITDRLDGDLNWPFTEWFYSDWLTVLPNSPTMGWTTHGFQAYGASPEPPLHCPEPTLIAYMGAIASSDYSLIGQVVEALEPGYFGPLGNTQFGDEFYNTYYPTEHFSQIQFYDPQQARSVLKGIVTKSTTGNPVAGVHVHAVGTSRADYTDYQGRYLLDSLIAAAYNISFQHRSYKDSIVTNVDVSPDTAELDIALETSPPQAIRTPFRWEYYTSDPGGAFLRVTGTVNCQSVGAPLFARGIQPWVHVGGSVPIWCNDYLMEIQMVSGCRNKSTKKVAAPIPGTNRSGWTLMPLEEWMDINSIDSLTLPSVIDTTANFPEIFIIVDLNQWITNPQPFQNEYAVIDGECIDLPGYLIGTTPITFDSLAGPESNPFETTPLSATLQLQGGVMFSPGYSYLPGDANMSNETVDLDNSLSGPLRVGGDVTFLVNYFDISSGNQPCLMFNPNAPDEGAIDGGYLFAPADATGDCQVLGGDVSRLVQYFGGNPEALIQWCGYDKPDPQNYFPPMWLNNRGSGLEQSVPPLEELPAGWPSCEIQPAISRVAPSSQGGEQK